MFYLVKTKQNQQNILQGNEHKYTVRITDAEGVNPNSIEMSIIMKLGENTDFTIKFE